jgi:hypothetical protein
MKTGDYDDAMLMAIRQIVKDWESGKTAARSAMVSISTLIDYVLSPAERAEENVYPFGESQREDPIESDIPARYGTDPEVGKGKS